MNYDNTNSGVLFGNLDSSEPKEDRKPNFDGSVNIDGKEYKLTGWVRYGKDGGRMAGRKFLSLKVEPKQVKHAAPIDRGTYDWKAAEAREPVTPQKETATAEFDDDIPF